MVTARKPPPMRFARSSAYSTRYSSSIGAILSRSLAEAQEAVATLFLCSWITVTRNLPRGELIERHVLVECRDHPIAVRPEQAVVMIVENPSLSE